MKRFLYLQFYQGLQLNYVMNEFQQLNPYQASVIRSDVTKAIGKFIPDVVEEAQLSMEEVFSPNGRSTQCHSLVSFQLILHSRDAT